MMSSHLVLPREGHLYHIFQIFIYLRKFHNTKMVFDPSTNFIDEALFERRGWAPSDFRHIGGKEEVDSNMLEPHGLGFTMSANSSADHHANIVTHHSCTGFLVFLNCTLWYWSAKKQMSMKSSSIGSEFVTMKQSCEYICGLHYKSCMIGIICNGPT